MPLHTEHSVHMIFPNRRSTECGYFFDDMPYEDGGTHDPAKVTCPNCQWQLQMQAEAEEAQEAAMAHCCGHPDCGAC